MPPWMCCSHLHHPNIIKLKEVYLLPDPCQPSTALCLVLELASAGTLMSHLRDHVQAFGRCFTPERAR